LDHKLAARTAVTITVLFLLTLFWGNGIAQDGYESYYLYLGHYPDNASPGYHEDVQGITHDDNNWFITQSDADDDDPAERSLWKIPVTHDLASVSPNDPGVLRISLDDIPALASKGYDHFGDLSYYKNENYDGEGYLVIPVAGGPAGILAVFRAGDLGFVGHAELSGGTDAGWCAIDANGNVYTSGWQVNKCEIYKLRWDLVPSEVRLQPIGEFAFLDESGNSLTLTHMQGGVISESGNLLYIVTGFYDGHYAQDGINVFDMQTGRRVAHSTDGYGHFNYAFDPGIEGEEPEGITIWDLDDGRAPGITGQLHVLLLDNNLTVGDDVYLKHYSGIIHVDGAYTGNEYGSPSQPFKTISKAYNQYPIWDGAQMKIKSGSYPDSLILSKRIRLLAEGGTIRIGE
jgi:hypothetical protein